MYTDNEKERLSKSVIRLLQRSIKDIRKDRKNTTSTLLRLGNFVRIAFNEPERCRNLMVLILAGMWNMFNKEVRK